MKYLNHLWRFVLFYVLVFKFLCCWPKKTWDELFRDARKKLGIDLTTLKTGLNRQGHLLGRLVNPQMRKMDHKLDIMIV